MIRIALKNPYLVIVFALAIVVMGVVSYQKIPADLLPIYETPAVQIVTFYPGMPPEVMEKDIMSRLQRWTGQSVGIEHQEAKAMQGVCIVKNFFREGISNADAMSQVTSYATSDMFYLPPGTIPPMVMPFDPTASIPLCLVVVSNPKMNEQQLYDIAYFELRNKLQGIQGVIAPAVYGGKLRRILAYVDHKKLEAYGLSLTDVQEALLRENPFISAGNIKIGKKDFQILTNALPETVEKLNDTPIKTVNGVPVYMRDIGKIENSSPIQSNVVRINRSRQVYIPIYRQPGANTIEIVKQINKLLPGILLRLKTETTDEKLKPLMDTLVLSVAMNQAKNVQKGLNNLQIAGGLGALLAGIIVFIFLRNFRSTFVVILAIPLAILVAIIGMYALGATFNVMTLGGLALAIGILVDQSIVVLENVTRHIQMGKKPIVAAYDGAIEVVVPIFVSTLTFVVVFLPVWYLTGTARYLFEPLAITAMIAILASFVISITLVPAYCAFFFKQQKGSDNSGTGSTTKEEKSGALGVAYQKMLKGVLVMRYPVVIVAGVLFVIAMIGMNNTGRELIPVIESPQFKMFVRMPTGTNIDETERRIKQIEQVVIDEIGTPDPGHALKDTVENYVEKHPESNLQLLISNIGVLMDWPAAYTPNSGAMDTFMLIQLKGKSGMRGAFSYTRALREKLHKQFPDVEISFDTGGMMSAAMNKGEPSPIHFQIATKNLVDAQEIADIIMEAAREVPGTRDVRMGQRYDYPALMIALDRDAQTRQGVTTEEVAKNVLSATNSSVTFKPAFWIDPHKGNHYFLGVQYREEDLKSKEDLLNVPVKGGLKQPRRLRNVATIEEVTRPGVVNHRNITRVTDVYANVDPDYDVGSVVSKIEAILLADQRLAIKKETDNRGSVYQLGAAQDSKGIDINGKYKGKAIRMQGEVRDMRETFDQFMVGLVISAILVYLVMVAQFHSFLDPFIVLLTVPLGFIGVQAILFLTQTNLSIMSFMGIIMVVGIVVEYSIVMVDFANHRLSEGMSVREAILDAAKVRLRPILMTSLTTWLALLPMAIGFGGSDANAPLARAIIGGVIGATFLSLIVLPCLYVIFKSEPNPFDDDDSELIENNPVVPNVAV